MPMVSSLDVSMLTLISRPSNSSGLSSQAMTQGSCSGAPMPPYFVRSKRSEKDSSPATASPVRLPSAANARRRVSVVSIWWVRSSGATVSGTPLRKTTSAACGSTIDIELGRRRDVADLEIGAAHHDDPAEALGNGRLLDEGHGNIGERPQGAQRDLAFRRRHHRVDDEIDAVLCGERRGRLGQCVSVEPGASMDMLGCAQRTHHRPHATGEDRHVRAAGKLDNAPRILLGQRQRHIAGDRNDAENVEVVR